VSAPLGAGLQDRGVLVTGATGGIGSAIVGALAQEGSRVAAVDLDQDAVDALVAGLDHPERHLGIAADLRETQRLDGLVRGARAELGSLHALVHVAGVLVRRPDIDAVTEDDWDLQHDVNLRATFFLNRAVARVMQEDGRGGRIINFASQGWWTGGFGGSTAYSASKGGVVSLSRGLARTLGPDGITVNCVAPGAVDTPMLREGMDGPALDAFRAQIPLGRFAEPAELAPTVVFLASDHAAYISGATINVSGGQLMY
jgi:NAD(P)-dependent dehydrogenase (short-subunit alcohol dehydrogenase family)